MKDTHLLVVALGALERHEKLQVRGLTVRPHNPKPVQKSGNMRDKIHIRTKSFTYDGHYMSTDAS